MSINKIDIVGEYLREVELRLSGLPLLQRRELLADLETHIASARAERNVQSDGELIEILERLGSPEVVAAAAYQEAGAPPPAAGPPTAPPREPGNRSGRRAIWIIAVAGTLGFLLLFLIGFVALFRMSSVEDGPVTGVERAPVVERVPAERMPPEPLPPLPPR